MDVQQGRREVEGQDGRREGEGQSINVVTLERFWDYSMWILKIAGGEILVGHGIGIASWVCLGFLVFTFFADSALWFLIFYLKSHAFNERGYTAAKALIYTTIFLMMLTSTSYLVLLNLRYAIVISLQLPVLMPIVGIVFSNGINTDQAGELTDYETLLPALKQFFDLSASVTAAAFTEMITTISNYSKNLPKDVDQVDDKFSKIFIFFTVNFGLLMMLLTTVPPSSNSRLRYITIIKFLSIILSGFLALTGLAVAAKFLGYLTLLAFLPILLAIVAWLQKKFIQEDGTCPTGHESKLDITITVCIFAELIAVDTFFGSEDNGFFLMTCMFLLSLSLTSSLSWMILTFLCPTTQSLAIVSILTWFSFLGHGLALPVLIPVMIGTYYRKRQNLKSKKE